MPEPTVTASQLAAAIKTMNFDHFRDEDGIVDGKKVVETIVDLTGGAARRGPTPAAQGRRTLAPASSGLAAGRDLYRNRHHKQADIS